MCLPFKVGNEAGGRLKTRSLETEETEKKNKEMVLDFCGNASKTHFTRLCSNMFSL